VARRNRVDPWGDLHAVPERGLFTGNRGCLVDDSGSVARHHRCSLWITCLTEFRGWHHPLAAPGIWTPVFFLDDAVALAAGHRPCALCRRDAYRSYRDAVTAAFGSPRPLAAVELNARLAAARLRRGRGIDRRGDRRLWTAAIDTLPVGTVIVGNDGDPHLVLGEHTRRFGFGGWGAPVERDHGATVTVLTPPTSVAALRGGYAPVLHHSAPGA
jgi:hypothetical protein